MTIIPRVAAAGVLAMALCAASAGAQPVAEQPVAEQPVADEVPAFPRPLPEQEQLKLTLLEPVAGGLTSSEVAKRTVANSATVRARQTEIEAAEARIDQTTAQFFPRVTLGASYTRLSPVSTELGEGALVGAANPGQLSTGPCPSGGGNCVLDAAGQPVGAAAFELPNLQNNYSLTASATIPLSDYVTRLSHALAGLSATRRAANLAYQAEQLKVRAEARVLYYNWVRAVGLVGVVQKSLEQTRARRKDSEAAYTLGTISRADLFRLEALMATAELGVKEAETLRDLSAEQLRIVMGDPVSARYKVGEDVLAPLSGTATQGGLEVLTREALSRRLEVAAITENTRSLRASASAVKATAYPRLDAFGDVTYANPNARYFPQQQVWNMTWAVGLSATWTISDAFTSSAAASELDANARNLEAQRQVLMDAIRQEVAAAYLERERAATAIKTSQRAVKAAEEAYRVATDLYQVGSSTTTELIAAERELVEARLLVLNAHVGRRIAQVRLWHAVGNDVPAAAP